MRWKNPLLEETVYQKTLFLALFISLLCLAYSIRFLNSISMLILPIICLAGNGPRKSVQSAFRDPFFLGCFFWVIMQITGLFYTEHPVKGWEEVITKSGLIAIPFLFCSGVTISLSARRSLMLYFSLALALVSLFCLVHSMETYLRHHDSSVFFYHQLVSLFSHHAVYFSFYLLVCIIYWLEEGLSITEQASQKKALIFLIIYFTLYLLLLSSKIAIGITAIYFVYKLFSLIHYKQSSKAVMISTVGLLIATILIFFTNNPIKKRFADMTSGNIELFKQEQFSEDIYFNGFQFRLLQWRFTNEILSEQKKWWLGVSPADAQYRLDEKYLATKMYKGDGINNKGYRGYNSHNQFLETTLQSGIIGLLFLVWIAIALLYKTRIKKESLILSLVLLSFCFTESLLETQYGIFLFSFFPLLSLSTVNYSAKKFT